MRTTTRTTTLACSFLLAVLAGPACALDLQPLRPDGVVVLAGGADRGVQAAGVGLAWQWDRDAPRRGAFAGHTEVTASRWQARDFGGGTQAFRHVVILPVVRLYLDGGRSPWFLEAGIGASWTHGRYVTPSKEFSTHFNFHDVLGFGVRFGKGQRHELGLRYVHVSNAGLKRPNPGEDFVFLRYVAWL